MTTSDTDAETMDNLYGDGSDHPACAKCGYCLKCGDCAVHGCGTGLASCAGCGAPEGEQHMLNCPIEAPNAVLVAWVRSADKLPEPGVRPLSEPLFLLHCGALFGGERDEWDVEANSGRAVDALADQHPGETLHLYALTPDDVAAVNKRRARLEWMKRETARCRCDHNEYCQHCYPESFRPGGMWHGLGA